MNQTQTESLPSMQMNLQSPGFDELVIEAIDKTFTNLGKRVKQTFYYFLKDHYKLDKEDIPHRIGDFVEALDAIFGIGAALIEINIIKSLQQEVPSFIYLMERSDLSFEGYLASLRGHIENHN